MYKRVNTYGGAIPLKKQSQIDDPESLVRPYRAIPLPIVKNGQVNFTTMRQELLTKPDNSAKVKKDVILTSECQWNEPFVLYYDENCAGDAYSMDENPLKFRIQMGYDEVGAKRRNVVLTEHLVGEPESFQLD